MATHARPAAWAVLAAALMLPLTVATAAAAALPSFFTDTLVVGGFSTPYSLDFFPNGTAIVVQHQGGFQFVNGSVRTYGGTLSPLSTSGEQGLLGVAVDPDYPTRPYIFVHYTTNSSVQVARLTITNATGTGPPSVDLVSKLVLLADMPNLNTNHNGGTVRFGPDKRLYVSIGDDAQGGGCTAQNLSFMGGKILRLNVDDTADPANRLTLAPTDNPFYNASNANASLVWALGLRNPFRFDIDPVTGLLFIGDVGQSAWEEIDVSAGGENFGWPYFEANASYRSTLCPTDSAFPSWTRPIYAFPNVGSAVVLGALYRGVSYPTDASFPAEFDENPFFFDFYHGDLRALRRDANASTWALVPGVTAFDFGNGYSFVTDMQVGPDGAIWYLGNNQLRRIAHQSVPTILTAALPDAYAGLAYSATLTVEGNAAPFTWSIVGGSLPPGLALGPLNGTIDGTPTQAGAFAFTVQASSSAGRDGTRDLSISVIDDLIVETAALPVGTVGTPYAHQVVANGSFPPYTWRVSVGALPPGLALSPTSGIIDGTPQAPGNFSFTLEATSSANRTATAALWIDVADPVTIYPDVLNDATQGQAYIAPLAAGGGNGPFVWSLDWGTLPDGLALTSGSGHITGTATAFGDWVFQVRATDSQGRAATRVYSIHVLEALVIETTTLPMAQQATPYSALLAAHGGTPPYNWALAANATMPPGLTLDGATGTVNGTPSLAGLYSLRVTLSDAGSQWVERDIPLTVAPPPGGPPLISLPALPAGYLNLDYNQTLTAIGGAPPFSWSLASGSLPPGLSLDAAGAWIAGVPSAAGDFTFVVRVNDSASRNDTRPFTLHIGIVQRSLRIVTTELPFVEVGLPYRPAPLAYAGENTSSEVRWSATGLPPGISLAGHDGTLSGSPTEGGFFNVRFLVDDERYALHDERTIGIMVYRVEIQTTELARAQVGVAYATQIVIGGSSTPATLVVHQSTLPPGLWLDAGYVLRGTPTQAGTFTFTLRAEHPNAPSNFHDRTLTLTVDPPGGPGATPSGTPVGANLWPLLLGAAVFAAGAGYYVLVMRRRRGPNDPD